REGREGRGCAVAGEGLAVEEAEDQARGERVGEEEEPEDQVLAERWAEALVSPDDGCAGDEEREGTCCERRLEPRPPATDCDEPEEPAVYRDATEDDCCGEIQRLPPSTRTRRIVRISSGCPRHRDASAFRKSDADRYPAAR